MGRRSSDATIMRRHLEKLGLMDKSTTTEKERKDLVASLRKEGHEDLAKYVETLGPASDLEDLIFVHY